MPVLGKTKFKVAHSLASNISQQQTPMQEQCYILGLLFQATHICSSELAKLDNSSYSIAFLSSPWIFSPILFQASINLIT